MQKELIDPRILKPHPNNSRLHSSEQLGALVASMREFGFTSVIVVDEDNTILAGHGRAQAAITVGLQTVPCLRVTDWSDAKKRTYVIADNQIGAASTWDESMLLHELQTLSQSAEIDLSQFGIDLSDLLPPADPPTDRDAMRDAELAAERRAPNDSDPDEAYRQEMADKRTKGQAPIVPMYAEHHQAFVIVCDNEIDEAWLRQLLGLNQPAQSYKDVKLLTPNVITVSALREAMR